jgi:26S proteasome regulatory subunit N5
MEATKEVALAIINMCFEAREWEAGIQQLFVLSKRKGQFKEAVKAIVQESIRYVDHLTTENHPLRDDLIEALRKITEGKIYVENERARLTRTYALLFEKQGDIQKAAKLLQSIQVETYGSMDQREKIGFLLEQTRLCLDCKDFIRAKIIANKVSLPALQKTEHQDLKIAYHRLLIRYHTHQKDFLEVCRSNLSIYDTDSIKAQKQQCEDILRLVCTYVVYVLFFDFFYYFFSIFFS